MHLDDAPHQPVRHDDRRLLGDAVAAAAIDGEERTQPPASRPMTSPATVARGSRSRSTSSRRSRAFSSRVSPAWSAWTRSRSFSPRSATFSRRTSFQST